MNLPQKRIQALAQEFKLELVILFGSQAKHQTHSESDIDIAFYALESINEEKLRERLMQIFHRADIDLINIYKCHNHLLRYQILSQGKVIFESRQGLKNNMEWQSYFDYKDFSKYYEMQRDLIKEKIAALTP